MNAALYSLFACGDLLAFGSDELHCCGIEISIGLGFAVGVDQTFLQYIFH